MMVIASFLWGDPLILAGSYLGGLAAYRLALWAGF
jgi:hypothetical protein